MINNAIDKHNWLQDKFTNVIKLNEFIKNKYNVDLIVEGYIIYVSNPGGISYDGIYLYPKKTQGTQIKLFYHDAPSDKFKLTTNPKNTREDMNKVFTEWIKDAVNHYNNTNYTKELIKGANE